MACFYQLLVKPRSLPARRLGSWGEPQALKELSGRPRQVLPVTNGEHRTRNASAIGKPGSSLLGRAEPSVEVVDPPDARFAAEAHVVTARH